MALTLQDLGKDLNFLILHKLDDCSITRISRVNQFYQNLYKNETFWMNRILTKFPEIPIEVLRKYRNDMSWFAYYRELNLSSSFRSDLHNYFVNSAAKGRLDKVIAALTLGADVNMYDALALKWSADNGHLEVVKYLVSQGANIRYDTIRFAEKKGHTEVVVYLESLTCWDELIQENLLRLLKD